MGLFFLPQSAAFAVKIFDNRVTTEPMIEMNSFKPSFSSSPPSERLLRCIPEAEGVPSALIYDFLKAIADDKTLNMHNITIVRNGKILCEVCFGAERLDVWKYTFSACKSIVSLAIGILVDDGVLALDDRVVDIFQKEVSAIAKLKLKDLTIEDLLTMQSPVLFAELDSATENDWIRGYFSAPIKGEVGREFKYNSLNTYILSAIITKKTGASLSDFIDSRLFSPIGIARDAWYWETCPAGIEKGGWGLYLIPEDFCKIALLVMQKGNWKGTQLISKEYVDMATQARIHVTEESALFDYGYHIWVGKETDTFLFNGMLGQNVIGFRNNGIIVVSNAGNGELFQQSNYFHYLKKFFDRPFDASAYRNSAMTKKLNRYVDQLSYYNLSEQGKKQWGLLKRMRYKKKEPELTLDSLVGRRFSYYSGYPKAIGLLPLVLQAVQNCYAKGFSNISFEKHFGSIFLVYEENERHFKIQLGRDIPKMTELAFGENRFLVAAQAKFKYDEEDRLILVIRIDFLEFPSSRILKFVFLNDDTVLLRHQELPGKDFAVEIVREHIGEFAEKPFLSGIMDRIGSDFFEFKAERSFAPELIVKRGSYK